MKLAEGLHSLLHTVQPENAMMSLLWCLRRVFVNGGEAAEPPK
jgi:hypothetical protein